MERVRARMECGPKPTLRLCFARCYAAFNARDLEGALALMHAGVTWANGWEGAWVNSMTVGPPEFDTSGQSARAQDRWRAFGQFSICATAPGFNDPILASR